MSHNEPNTKSHQKALLVKSSFSARLIPCLSYASLAFGVLLSSALIIWYLNWVAPGELTASTPALRLMANAGMPAMTLIYVSALLGLLGIIVLFARLMIDVEKDSPAASIYIPSGVISLLAGVAYWWAMSYVIDIIIPGKLPAETDLNAVMNKAFLMFGVTIFFAIIALVFSVYAVFSKQKAISKLSFKPLLTVFIFECVLVYLMLGNQYRTWWLLSAAY